MLRLINKMILMLIVASNINAQKRQDYIDHKPVIINGVAYQLKGSFYEIMEELYISRSLNIQGMLQEIAQVKLALQNLDEICNDEQLNNQNKLAYSMFLPVTVTQI